MGALAKPIIAVISSAYMWRLLVLMTALAVGCGGGDGNGNGDGDGGANGGDGGAADGSTSGTDAGPKAPQYTELWYSVDDRLVRIPLNAANGTVEAFVVSTITNPPPLGQNLLTMLDDGSLVGGRLSTADDKTYFYHIPNPPRDGSDVTVVDLGVMIEDLMIEGLYTDCDGRLYGMDTGTDNTNADGNRLLRFTGNFLGGDFSYAVVSNLATADVADIDDMGPGIDNNTITDNPGLAIDTGHVHDFNYETGSGTEVGTGGTYGIHALGADLFDDSISRLFVFSSDADLYEMNPSNYTLSASLGTGPADVDGLAGHSGLAGPLTDCESGFTPVE